MIAQRHDTPTANGFHLYGAFHDQKCGVIGFMGHAAGLANRGHCSMTISMNIASKQPVDQCIILKGILAAPENNQNMDEFRAETLYGSWIHETGPHSDHNMMYKNHWFATPWTDEDDLRCEDEKFARESL